jgi:asparagine synthase (glutamine-hydrolysing)
MCGIAGVVHLRDGMAPPELELLARMASALRHRGPDEFGCYRDGRAGLAHTRLSIVDLASGQQPLANEDQSVWVVFNGEVFDFVELREQLEALGHVFRTRSDTEVIVHAWEAWGTGAFERFNGQWAIALWDAKREVLVLSRDRLGVRPLYFAEHEGRLLFASEVKSLFAERRLPRALDPIGLDETFTFWSVLPPRSMFAGVSELQPGHVLTIDVRTGARTDVAYWSPRHPEVRDHEGRDPFALSLPEATEVLRHKLAEATKLRTVRADVPVGAYLSGGLDSSLIAALGREVTPGRFQTFSVRFADDEYDEGAFQRLMVAQLGSEHAEIVVTRADIAAVFPEVIVHTERPILRTAPAPLFLLSRRVRAAGIKVVLTGEGADEMLGGYDLFREHRIRRFWARAPHSSLRPRLFERLYPYLARSPAHARGMALKFWGRGLERAGEPTFSHALRWEGTAALKRLFTPGVREEVAARDPVAELVGTLPPEFMRWDPLAQAQYLEVRTLLSPYLLCSQGDRMLMGNSVEGRFPFLDRDVVEFCNALPASYKLRVLDEKHLLKRAAVGWVPQAIIARSKQPYRAPDALAFVGTERVPEYVAELFSVAALARAGLFDPRAAHGLYRKLVERGRASTGAEPPSHADNMAFVGVLSTQLLQHAFVHAAPSTDAEVAWTTRIDRVGMR